MRKAFSLGLAIATASTGAVMFAAAPASAASRCTSSCTATTNVTFTISGSGLTISVPTNPTVTLTAGAISVTGESATGALNATTVSDLRGIAAASWTVTADAGSGFTGQTSSYNIPDANGAMDLGVTNLTTLSVTGALVPTSGALTPTAFNSTSPMTLVSGTTAVSGTLTYTPNLTVTIPTAAPADTYTGAVVQTVS